jgi:hypothetical protein
MHSETPTKPASLVDLVRQSLLPALPRAMRDEFDAALPAIGLLAYQLGVDVIVAEQQSFTFAQAVRRPEFIKMARVYFGAINLLQWPLTSRLKRALRELLAQAAAGQFEAARAFMFAIATREGDPQAGLCRFLLWVAARLNLLSLTWNTPGVEVRGSLNDVEELSEAILRSLLDRIRSENFGSDARPLHLLVAELLVHTQAHDESLSEALTGLQSELSDFMAKNAAALGQTRDLDARTAAMFWPVGYGMELGYQQIADLFPQHFPSADALERRRNRFLKDALPVQPRGDRFIDVLQAEDLRK